MEDFNNDFSLDFDFDSEKKENEIKIGDVVNGVVVTGVYEDDAKAEISETLRKFKEQAKAESALKDKNTDTNYWFAVYFASREQRDEFLNKMNLIEKMLDQYIAGDDFAKACNVPISKEEIVIPKRFRGIPKDTNFDVFELDL